MIWNDELLKCREIFEYAFRSLHLLKIDIKRRDLMDVRLEKVS
jgi:hypothetical protein